MFASLSVTFLVTSVLCSGDPDPPSSLRMVTILFRHGARSPVVTFPTDPNRLYPWVGGYGALQPKGTEEVLELGKNLRQRYGSLLPKDGLYSKENMYIVSSVEERCIMSAQGLLAGLLVPPDISRIYPGSPGSINISLRWQPAAVNVLSEAEDNILLQSRDCSRVDTALDQFDAHPTGDYMGWKEQVYDQMAYVSKHAGSSIDTLIDLFKFYDALNIASNNGLPVPDWTESIYPKKALECYQRFMLRYTATPELKRLRGGVILTEFLKNMQQKREGKLQPDRSIFIYSGHDRTQLSLLDSIGLINQTTAQPAFASAVVFELHQNLAMKDDLEIRILYYDDASVSIPRQLKISGCSDPCPLKRFESVTQDLYISDFDEACSSASARHMFKSIIIRIGIILLLSLKFFKINKH